MKLEQLGCKRGVVGLVLPTGYSFNLDGTAIYLTLASLFCPGLRHRAVAVAIFAMVSLMLLTSKGAAGVTGSGFVALVATRGVPDPARRRGGTDRRRRPIHVRPGR
jgi:Na+/H+-dicarboxylate symporter